MAGIHTNTQCPSCGNQDADYFYDSHDREVIIECEKCDYQSSEIKPMAFEIARRQS